jgi:hypothetical protein
MPISLSQLAKNTAQVTYQGGENPEDTVTLTYWPARVTEQFLAAAQVFENSQGMDLLAGFIDFNKSLAVVIQRWDIYEDDEQTQMFPIDPDRFKELPIALRIGAYTAIASHIRPENIAPQVVTPQN